MSILAVAAFLFAVEIESVAPNDPGEVCFETTLDAKVWMALAKKQLGPEVVEHPTKKMLSAHYSEMDGASSFHFEAPVPPAIAAETVSVLHESGVQVVHADSLQGTLLVREKEREASGVACSRIGKGIHPLFVLRKGEHAEFLGAAEVLDAKTFRWKGKRHTAGEQIQGNRLQHVAVFRLGNDRTAALLIADGTNTGCDGTYVLVDLGKPDLPVIEANGWGCGD